MFEHEKHLVGVYDNEQDAIQAVEDLKRQGYATDDISVISKNEDEVHDVNEATGTKTEEGLAAGAATGGVLGGLTGLLAGIGALAIPGIGPIVAAGPIAATLTGAAVGAGAGGLAGALIGMGIPEDEAERYEGYVKEGKILVVVERDENRVGLNNDATAVDALDGTRTRNPVDAPLTSDNPANTRFDNTRDF
ncbi:general stress protein [Bacillus sp. ISL-55]|uniref:general stress protein n=1 Tax=Bacillus sp. ISL-55 TaxID=2819134 RepID=UPI001BE698A6|nr:general stress protein [Bacillus sp. ISL-55]MBT2693950.1 general stress protein [Bacillus sp. ISL-55]